MGKTWKTHGKAMGRPSIQLDMDAQPHLRCFTKFQDFEDPKGAAPEMVMAMAMDGKQSSTDEGTPLRHPTKGSLLPRKWTFCGGYSICG